MVIQNNFYKNSQNENENKHANKHRQTNQSVQEDGVVIRDICIELKLSTLNLAWPGYLLPASKCNLH